MERKEGTDSSRSLKVVPFLTFFFVVGGLLLTSPAKAQRTLESPNVETGGAFGSAVAGMQDIDGDDTPDLVIGAPGETGSDPTQNSEAGQVYVLSGSDYSELRGLTSPNPNSQGAFGTSVAGIGDLNGDNIPDVLVGAPGETVNGETNAGRAYLMSGDDGSLVHTLTSPNVEEDGDFGRSVASLGDANGDNIPDVIVGADDETVNGETEAGRAYVISGDDASVLYTLTSPNVDFLGHFGSVAGVEDLDGDDVPDVLVGAPGEDESSQGGSVHVFSGSDGTLIRSLSSPTPESSGQFGFRVEGIGDIDGDGTPDLLVGTTESGEGVNTSGRVHLMSGDDGSLVHSVASPHAEEFGLFGSSVNSLGDVDKDSVPDILVGAPEETVDGNSGTGRAYAISGADGSVIGTMTSANSQNDGNFGASVAGVPDIDGDGISDPLVGASNENVSSFDEGRSYVFRSANDEIPVELASFEGKQIEAAAVELAWTTASETNNAGFRIQHNRNGQKDEWREIGQVDGAGTTDQPQTYRFVATNLAPGTHQFRLKQIDLDGSVHLSEPVTVELSLKQAVHLSAPTPNPVRHQATVSFAVKTPVETTVTLYNVLGQKVATLYQGTPSSEQTMTVDLSTADLSSGVYLMHLQAGERTRTRHVTVAR